MTAPAPPPPPPPLAPVIAPSAPPPANLPHLSLRDSFMQAQQKEREEAEAEAEELRKKKEQEEIALKQQQQEAAAKPVTEADFTNMWNDESAWNWNEEPAPEQIQDEQNMDQEMKGKGKDWGKDGENGDWVTFRSSLSVIFSIYGGLFLLEGVGRGISGRVAKDTYQAEIILRDHIVMLTVLRN